MQYFKSGIIIILLIYFLHLSAQTEPNSFLWFVDVLMHEAGHLIFSIFGEFISAAGGSINQILIPSIFFGYFIFKKQYYSSAIILFWVGENLLSVAVYAGDAIKMQLPLLGGDSSIHDWNYLLTSVHLLNYTPEVSGFIKFIGILCILGAGILGIVYSFYPENKQSP